MSIVDRPTPVGYSDDCYFCRHSDRHNQEDHDAQVGQEWSVERDLQEWEAFRREQDEARERAERAIN